MLERTVGDLRIDAGSVLRLVDLSGTFLMNSGFESRYRTGEFGLVTAFAVNTKVERSASALLCWVRHRAWCLVGSEELELPDDPEDIPETVIEEHLAWRAESEWVAQYTPLDGADLMAPAAEAVTAFGMVMAPPTIHPYAREHFQALVSKSPYPAFTLPHLTPISQLPDDEVIQIEDA